MLRVFTDMFKNKEIRNRIFFTLVILLIYRLGSAIPAPRIDSVKLMAGLGNNNTLALINMLGGGQLQRFSIFSLGVGPYITASIVIQMLSMDIIPALSELAKSGEQGKKQLDKITRYLALVLSFIQAFTLTYAFDIGYSIVRLDGGNPILVYTYVAVVLTAGTMFLCWLGDRISIQGIGNGVSILIFTGIVSGIPAQFVSIYETLIASPTANTGLGILGFVGYALVYVLIIILVIFRTQATRKIPIQYTSSSVGRRGNDMTFIPLKINTASVMPVIFANAIMTAPQTLLSFFKQTSLTTTITNILNFQKPIGFCIYLVLIVVFTFFYTDLQVDPEKMSENLNKNGSYIVGVRPGKDTQRYISTILNRITVLGALFITFIAALPPLMTILFPSLPPSVALGGTGVIIVVGVALETMKDLEGKLTQRTYHGFVNKK